MVKITKNIVNRTDRVYGHNNKKKYITIHETANTSKGADATTHGRLQQNGFSASWHYTVDDKQAVQSFPHTAQCWHAGDGRGNGNLNSIGIEICVNSDGDFKKAVKNAAKLVKKIMSDEGISISNVVQHNHWSGKNCPTNLRNGSKGVNWDDFINMVKGDPVIAPAPSKPSNPSKPKGKTISQMADEVIAGKHGQGHSARRKSLGISQAEYEKVRAEVNRRSRVSSAPKAKPKSKTVSQMAQEVIDGKHGNGHDARRKSLGISQSVYNQVRNEVNRRLTGGSTPSSSGKSISQMANEVIAGKHGNGHAERRKSLGISQSQYEKVRAKVNKRL